MTTAEFLAEIEPHVRLTAQWLARRYRRRGVEVDDLYQEGMIAGLQLAPAFDASLGNKPWTMVALRVRGAMVDYLRERHEVIRLRLARLRGTDAVVHQLTITDDTFNPGRLTSHDAEVTDGAAAEFAAALRSLRAGLHPSEIALLIERHVHDRSMKEIGSTRGVHESRGSQLHTIAVEKIKAAAAERGWTVHTLFAV